MRLEVGVLGPIEARRDGRLLDLRGPRQRRLLAALALSPGVSIDVSHLIDIVWPDADLPSDPRETLRTYVSRLRSSLQDANMVIGRAGGYALNIEPAAVDAVRFEHGLERTQAGAVLGSDKLKLLNEMLALWRGPALSGFEHEEWARPSVARFTELRAIAIDERGQTQIELGHFEDAVASLRAAAAEQPLRERPHRLLMTSLHRCGRQAEALRVYNGYRRRLATDLGLEPGEEIRSLERRIVGGSPDEPAAALAQADAVHGYELQERIGEGAFAVVYRGLQPSVQREVAIKEIRAELADRPEFIRRFTAEAHLVAHLEHPHIVPLYDYWREPARAYLVMRWFRQGSLEAALADGVWTLERAITMANQIGSALAYAHRCGVIHRDVKPANILLDEDGNAYLGDFGIADGVIDARRVRASRSVGSPSYAAPEQVRGEPVGPAADVFGLAVVVHEVMTGRLPETVSTAIAKESEQGERDVPIIPPAIAEVLCRATMADVRERTATIDEFIAALARAARPFVAAGPSRRSSGVRALTENPFKGLRAFDEADAADFFGRQRMVDSMLERLSCVESAHLLTVIGPSRSGKSSLVRAGLLPALRAGRIDGSANWYATSMVPGAHPFAELEGALRTIATGSTQVSIEPTEPLSRCILSAVERLVPDDTDLLLVIDQFEELFTLVIDEDERRQFIDALAQAISSSGSPLRVVLTLRADFYDRPLRYQALAELLSGSAITLNPLAPDELEQVITEPATRAGALFEPGLVSSLLADVANQPGALPLLQYTLTELFDRSRDGILQVDDYRSMGGLTGALAARADRLFVDASAPAQRAIRRLIVRLITFGEGVEDTRRRVCRSELSSDEHTDEMIDAYGRARLISFDRHLVTREPTVEVAHEALIREWPRLRGWLDEDRVGLRVHRQLTTAADSWHASNLDPSELFRGTRLATTEEWAHAHGDDLNETEQSFLDASTDARLADVQVEQQRWIDKERQNRRLRRLLVSVAAVAAVALIAGTLAWQQRNRARNQSAAATAAAFLAETGRIDALPGQLVASNRRAGLPIAVEAYRRAPGPASLGALQEALVGSEGLVSYAGGGKRYEVVEWIDAHRFAAARADAVDIFLDDGELLSSVAIRSVNVIAISPAGDLLAAGHDGRVSFVDLATGSRLPNDTKGDSADAIQALAFAPDGASLAMGTHSGTVRIVDVRTRADVQRFIAHPERTVPELGIAGAVVETTLHVPASAVRGVTAIVFVDDRSRIATAGFGAIRVWDRFSSRMLATASLTRHADEQTVVSVAAAMDTARMDGGTRLVVADRFQSWIFDPDTLRDPIINDLPGRGSFTSTVDPDSALDVRHGAIAADYGVGVTKVVDADGKALPRSIDTQLPPATDLALSVAGTRVVVAGSDGLAVVSLAGDSPLGRAIAIPHHGDPFITDDGEVIGVTSVVHGESGLFRITADGATPIDTPGVSVDFLTIGDANTFTAVINEKEGVALVDLPSGRLRAWLAGWDMQQGAVGEISNADESLMTVQSVNGDHLEVRSTKDGSLVRRIEGGPVGGLLAFGPTPTQLTTVDVNSTISIWDITTGAVRRSPPLGPYEIVQLAWTPDGSTLVTVRGDGTIVVRDPRTFQPTTKQFTGNTTTLSGDLGPWFTEDGTRMVTATDGNGRLWDLASGSQIGRAFPSADGWTGGASSNARWLVTGRGDTVVRWNLDVDSWVHIACRAAGRNLTRAEWEQFGPRDLAYRATCPDEYAIENSQTNKGVAK